MQALVVVDAQNEYFLAISGSCELMRERIFATTLDVIEANGGLRDEVHSNRLCRQI